MNDSSESLAAFRRLLETTAEPSVDRPVLLTDSLVGPIVGSILRRCAVPHEFDQALLQRLGNLSEVDAVKYYTQFSELSVIQVNANSLSVHERWRRPLWQWWLRDEQRSDFIAVNEILVKWFDDLTKLREDDVAARRRMFHLIAYRPDEGLQAFERLFRTARHRRQFSECSLLLRLVHEYDFRLPPSARALLTYQEGKLASDLRHWESALDLLSTVANNEDAAVELRVYAEVRYAHALRQVRRLRDALTVLEKAQSRIEANPAIAGLEWRVLYELGEVYRDLGQADVASTTLATALNLANDDEEEADIAGVLNSLGTVQLQLREIDGAINSFRASLDHLKRHGDAVRIGSVFNNLGLAQIERCNWKDAEASLTASLESKRAAGDQLGQATTLLNLSRVQAAQDHLDEASRSAEQSATLYMAVSDIRGRLRAQLSCARLLRRLGREAESTALLKATVDEAQGCGDVATATAALGELSRTAPRRGLPWWGWLTLIIGLVCVCYLATFAINSD